MSDKKLELIIQMLNKAESTTPEEAEALMEHAERLMLKYAIDQAVIDERRSKKGESSEKVVEATLHFTGAYRGEMINLGAAVVHGLGTLRAMQNTRTKTFVLHLFGYESDVEQAKLLITSLQIQSGVAVRDWWKLNKDQFVTLSSYEQEKRRRSFVHGFGTGAGRRILDSRATAVQEVTKGTELVLVSRKARVDEFVDALGAKKSRARTATGGDMAAAHGYRAGQNANTGGKAVSNTKGIEA
jgi:hypothetical protein